MIIGLFIWQPSSCFTFQVGKRMATLSEIAYQKSKSLESWNCSKCKLYKLTDLKAHESVLLDAQGYVGYYPAQDEIVVVFRGITDVRNWISDMHFKQTPFSACEGCQVHKAFYSQFDQIAFFVRDSVLALRKKYPTAKISITGHSLGSSLAVFCALDLKFLFGGIRFVYTFGQPRIGNQPFANYVADLVPQLTRVVYNCDQIAHSPQPNAGGLQYRHPPTEVWAHDKSVVICSSDSGEDPSCTASCPSVFYSDNSIDAYLSLFTTPAMQ